jgi:hypothetical protein
MLAENRVRVLLAELARATPAEVASAGGHAKAATSDDATKQPSPYAEALTTNGISRQTAHRYQALAAVACVVLVLCRSKIAKPGTMAGFGGV